jgi:hypothetical protein
MKTLTSQELSSLAGTYFSPQGYYQYTKSLPFLGTVTSNISSLTAGQWTEIILTYEVGASGLADGAWIKGTFKFYSVRESILNTKVISKRLLGLGSISNIRSYQR